MRKSIERLPELLALDAQGHQLNTSEQLLVDLHLGRPTAGFDRDRREEVLGVPARREQVEERAAILERDADMSPEQARETALSEVVESIFGPSGLSGKLSGGHSEP